MINIVHAWNFMYENAHSYELLLFMYDILDHGYEILLIMDDQYWSVHHIMTPKQKNLNWFCLFPHSFATRHKLKAIKLDDVDWTNFFWSYVTISLYCLQHRHSYYQGGLHLVSCFLFWWFLAVWNSFRSYLHITPLPNCFFNIVQTTILPNFVATGVYTSTFQ